MGVRRSRCVKMGLWSEGKTPPFIIQTEEISKLRAFSLQGETKIWLETFSRLLDWLTQHEPAILGQLNHRSHVRECEPSLGWAFEWDWWLIRFDREESTYRIAKKRITLQLIRITGIKCGCLVTGLSLNPKPIKSGAMIRRKLRVKLVKIMCRSKLEVGKPWR